MSQTINWGVIGNSDISRKRGGPAILAGPDRRLTAIYSRDQSRAEQFAREQGDTRDGETRAYSDLSAFLDDPEIHAVSISSELYRHCPETIACAEAGKHVLCEKPMALDPDECGRMIAACRAHNVRLSILFPRRYFPKIELMRQMIADGAIGRPVTARISASSNYNPSHEDPKHWRVVTGKSGGGNLQDMGSHYLDLLVSLLGDCAEVCGLEDHLKHDYEAPDTESALLRMKSGAHVTAHFHWSLGTGLSGFDVYGTEGAFLATPVDGPPLVLLRPGKPEQTWHLPPPPNTYVPVFDDFDRALRTGTEPRFPGEEGAKSTAIIHAIQRSSRTGQRVRL